MFIASGVTFTAFGATFIALGLSRSLTKPS